MTCRTVRTLWGVGALALLAAVLASALWLDSRRLVRVEVEGLGHAAQGDVVALARVEAGQRLYDLAPALLEDRIRRHPWVASVEATRWPSGVLHLRITERVPVALAVDADGAPAALLAADGAAMPPSASALALDLPLVHGRVLPVNRARPVESAALRAFLAALPGLSPDADALVSDVRLTPGGEIVLTTAPTATGTALDVRLGRDDMAGRLERLAAFWQQAVATRAGTRYAVVDVRYAGLVVTREAAPGAAFADSTAPAGQSGPIGIDSTAARRATERLGADRLRADRLRAARAAAADSSARAPRARSTVSSRSADSGV